VTRVGIASIDDGGRGVGRDVKPTLSAQGSGRGTWTGAGSRTIRSRVEEASSSLPVPANSCRSQMAELAPSRSRGDALRRHPPGRGEPWPSRS
jgi:hypothetical protein